MLNTDALFGRMTAEEEAQLGLRRGRSARAASPPLELPPTRRVKRLDALAHADTPELEASSQANPSSDFTSEGNPTTGASTPEARDPSLPPCFMPREAQPVVNGTNGNGILPFALPLSDVESKTQIFLLMGPVSSIHDCLKF